MGLDFNVNEAIDRALKWWRRKRHKKVLWERFLARIVKDYRFQNGLDEDTKDDIFQQLDDQRRIIRDGKGHYWVVATAVV